MHSLVRLSIEMTGGIKMLTPSVDFDLCVGCGACTEVCPEVFQLRDDKAWVIGLDKCNTCNCQEAADICPVQAIIITEG